MTYEEQADRLKMLWNIIGINNKYLNESFTSAITMLEKAEQYRWHDLRKNPEDLPLIGYTVLAWFDDGNAYTCVRYGDSWAYSEYDCLRQVNKNNEKKIIAWREIETSEVEE